MCVYITIHFIYIIHKVITMCNKIFSRVKIYLTKSVESYVYN